ncbi:hypothetical protein VCRA2128O94_300020 [Vibrio crassostreae]|nr:hypothetical protein VCRA2128O94_300020 [Vibrio crassostreae]
MSQHYFHARGYQVLDEDKAANAGNLYHRWQEGYLIETRG